MPAYDPNYFTDVLTDQEWLEIQRQDHPLHNRALSAYPPGSTFKIITLLTALADKNINRKATYFCQGYIKYGGRELTCWQHSGHGRMNLMNGFINSCNIVFYNLGMKLDHKNIANTAVEFGLGSMTGVDLPYESKGLIPTAEWKKDYYNKEWYPGDTVNMSIGQGFVLATPLQMATLVAVIANRNGSVHKPFIVKQIISSDKETIMLRKPEILSSHSIDQEDIKFIREAMSKVVISGTGKGARIKDYAIAGKTGTSEVFNKEDHGWFVSYGPTESPNLAVAVFIEHGGQGSGLPVRISSRIYNWWKENRI